jgi:hypothetical protein
MGNARFLKTIRGRTTSRNSAIVVKIFVKPDMTWELNEFVFKAKGKLGSLLVCMSRYVEHWYV